MNQKSKWLIFTLLAIAQFMIVLDVSITNVALVTIKQNLHFSNSSLQWVITAYALTFGGFLLLGGRAADLFGRRRTLVIGMVSFTIFSLLIGLSQSSSMLIVLRALQGLAAALMSPSALSIVLVTFGEGPERNKALGYWTLIATGGAAMGLLLGGVLTQFLGWRWDFFVNVPIGILVAIGILKNVPAHEKEATHNNLDLPGAILVTGGLITLVYALSQGPVWGWLNSSLLLTIAAAIVLLIAFIFNESKTRYPLMPLTIFKIRNVTGANVIMAPIYAGMLGMFFITSLYIQSILNYSPVLTGLSFLPFPIILAFVSTRVPRFVSRIGYKPFLIAGPLLIAIAIAWLSRLPVHGTYLIDVLPTLLVMPIGVGMTF
ncbi:MAG TPA: MFS transporter, partial [Methylomirabilota bacterium]|nr:MFS transporter [Methylomirabilota bacterium]